MDITFTVIAVVITAMIFVGLEQKARLSPEEYAARISERTKVPPNYWVYATVTEGMLLNAEVWEMNRENTHTRPVCTLTYPLPARLTHCSARRVSKYISQDCTNRLCDD